jgi:hypothetical protein
MCVARVCTTVMPVHYCAVLPARFIVCVGVHCTRLQRSNFGTHSSLLPYHAPTAPFPTVLRLTLYAATWWCLRSCRPRSPVCHALCAENRGKRDLWGSSVRVVEEDIPAFTVAAAAPSFSSSCLSLTCRSRLMFLEANAPTCPAG